MDPLVIGGIICSAIAIVLAFAADLSFARVNPPISARDGHNPQ